MSARTMIKSESRLDSSSLVDPFKGRTLVRSPRKSPRTVQTISIQYDYQNTTPPQTSQMQVRRESIKKPEESLQEAKATSQVSKSRIVSRTPPNAKAHEDKSKVFDRNPPNAPIVNEEDAVKSPVPTKAKNNVPKGRVLSRTPPPAKVNMIGEEEKMKRNYIPKGNVLARTPPDGSDEPAPNNVGHRRNSIDFLKPALNTSRLERISMREYFEYEKDLLNSDLQSRLDNAKTKIDTGRVITRPKRKANKGVQVSLLKFPLPRTESPSEQENKRKLPEITEKKSKPYLKARQGKTTKKPTPVSTAVDEDKGAEVEEFVLAMRMIKKKDGSHEVKEVELKPVGQTGKNRKKSKKSTLPVRIF